LATPGFAAASEEIPDPVFKPEPLKIRCKAVGLARAHRCVEVEKEMQPPTGPLLRTCLKFGMG
jgi:hypothetical protein